MRGTGTQGTPETDKSKVEHYEELGRKNAERLSRRRINQKADAKRSKLTIVTDDTAEADGNIVISPKIRAEAEAIATEAYKTPPVTTQSVQIGFMQVEQPIAEPVIKRDSWPDQTTKNPRVCLSMIVKNEGKVLWRCLESVKGHVDEIVIIDTGSTDNTIDIAKAFGAKIFHHKWQESFSEARNWAIYHTDCEWLLQLDADEELDKNSGPKIRDAVKSAHDSTVNLIHMVMVNVDEARNQEQSVVNTGKLMRVIPSLHFTRRIHNKLHCVGDTILTQLKIYHYGYALPDKEYMKFKKDRTTRLLLLQAKETPDDPEVPYYLGIQYLRFEIWDKAIEYSKAAIELFELHEPDSQLVLLAHHVVACASYHRQISAKSFDFSEAIKYSEMALKIYPDYADSNSILSSIYFAIKDYEKCLKYSERFLAACEMLRTDPSKALVIPMNTLKNEWLIYLQLAINYFEQANSHRAIYFIAKSEDLLPEGQKHKPSFGVFKYLIMRGDAMSLKRAEAIYQEGFRSDANPIDEFHP
jgi:glycosyltransferase involved in cell wall biosynthesis